MLWVKTLNLGLFCRRICMAFIYWPFVLSLVALIFFSIVGCWCLICIHTSYFTPPQPQLDAFYVCCTLIYGDLRLRPVLCRLYEGLDCVSIFFCQSFPIIDKQGSRISVPLFLGWAIITFFEHTRPLFLQPLLLRLLCF